MRITQKRIIKHFSSHRVGYLYGLLVVLIVGPLLLPGYILTLDMVWVPHISMPSTVGNTYLLYLLLTTLNTFIPSDILQKLILSITLWGIAYGTYRLVSYIYQQVFKSDMPLSAAFAAGIFAVVNPFTYARFMDGHWQVLIGYAALPWIAWRLMVLIRKPTLKNALWWALPLLVLTSAGSVHMIPMGIMLCIAILIGCINRARFSRKLLILVAGTLCAVAALNLLWIIPNVMGDGTIASKVSSFDYRHNATFRTRSFGWVPSELNVMTLHGYWGEAEGRFMVVQRLNPLWLLIFVVILGIAIYGAVALIKERRKRRLVLSLLGLATVALILSVGTYSWLFGWFNSFLIKYIPLFAGYREPQKFAAVIALIFSILFGIGIARLMNREGNSVRQKQAVIAAGILLPVMYTPFIFFGTMGQLHTTFYPSEWQQINERFSKEGGDFAVVFMPWNNYFYFEPAGRTIANPAARFFTNAKIIQSEDPGLGLIPTPQKTAPAKTVQSYIIEGKDPLAARFLADYDVKYILLAKTGDPEEYEYLDKLNGFSLVEDTRTTRLYKNEFYHGQ